MNAVPFTIEVYGGLGQCQGIIRDEGKNLVVEFQISDSIAHVLKSNVRQVAVPLADLVSVALSKGWFSTKIVLQSARMESLQDVPGMNQGRVELCVARKDRPAAERFVADLYQDEAPDV